MDQITQRIRWCRQTFTKLTQTDVAFLLGVSINTVSSWECGHYFPSVLHAYQLATLFKCSFGDLFLVNGVPLKELISCNG